MALSSSKDNDNEIIIIVVEERRSVRRRGNSNVAQQHSARERNKEVLLRRRDGERGESDEGWGEQNESESVLGISGVERGRRRVPRGDAVGDGENNGDGVGENGTTRRGGKQRVKLCVQGSMGTGVFQGLPLSLSGISRLIDLMDWEEDVVERISNGAIGKDHAKDDEDVFILICPQNIVGYSILPYMEEMMEVAGDRPMILFNPKLGDIQSAERSCPFEAGKDEWISPTAGKRSITFACCTENHSFFRYMGR